MFHLKYGLDVFTYDNTLIIILLKFQSMFIVSSLIVFTYQI